MILKPVEDLMPGDVVRFRPEGSNLTVSKSRMSESDPALWLLDFRERPEIVTLKGTELTVVSMLRPFTVPCAVCREEFRLVHNVASGGRPRAVICGPCDERTTQEVMQLVKEKKAAEMSGEARE